MGDVRQLVEQIRSDLKPLEGRILHHPYLDALDKGQVKRKSLKVFAGQQYHVIGSDLRSVAQLVSRHGHLPSRRFLLGVLEGETAAFEELLQFGAALGMTEGALKAFEPLPGGHAYCAFVAWLSLYGSDAELAAAFLLNFAAWGANCGRMSKALTEQYDFLEADVEFFDRFANLPPFEEEALLVIQGGLDRGIAPALIVRAARLLQAYELMYWDAIGQNV